jgi:hypothetical protein
MPIFTAKAIQKVSEFLIRNANCKKMYANSNIGLEIQIIKFERIIVKNFWGWQLNQLL